MNIMSLIYFAVVEPWIHVWFSFWHSQGLKFGHQVVQKIFKHKYRHATHQHLDVRGQIPNDPSKRIVEEGALFQFQIRIIWFGCFYSVCPSHWLNQCFKICRQRPWSCNRQLLLCSWLTKAAQPTTTPCWTSFWDRRGRTFLTPWSDFLGKWSSSSGPCRTGGISTCSDYIVPCLCWFFYSHVWQPLL